MENYDNLIAVIATNEDIDKLESLHFMVESKTNLLVRMMTGVNQSPTNNLFNTFMKDYEQNYKDYVEFKAYIENKYKPVEIADKAISWRADFENREIIFEVAEC